MSARRIVYRWKFTRVIHAAPCFVGRHTTCALGGFLVGRETIRVMLPRGRGTIIFTGASASLRGNAGFAAFSAGKQALRALARSMAREFGPQGIHVGHVVFDGPIKNDVSRELLPEAYVARSADGISQPQDIAEIYWH